ncbi:hypothetical protein DYB37_011119 [Aphanomyces astaci]|uniref:Uncharacterized protein n=1 Tax=Aphanomyces astaci TaxID=112090 RepID=A0A3R7A1Y0_APHAT|nr:hypothetical protein DYB35_013510 [Aphanomyces astaci]RHZ03220.1 hypothetical protein DYB37_011119 [Aphanomyces astaci]
MKRSCPTEEEPSVSRGILQVYLLERDIELLRKENEQLKKFIRQTQERSRYWEGEDFNKVINQRYCTRHGMAIMEHDTDSETSDTCQVVLFPRLCSRLLSSPISPKHYHLVYQL